MHLGTTHISVLSFGDGTEQPAICDDLIVKI